MSPTVTFLETGQPCVTVIRTSAAPSPFNRALHVEVLARDDRGRWKYLGGGARPSYSRPFHGGHDGIRTASLAVGEKSVLLLWQSAMPIHGPVTLSGAWRKRER